MTGWAWTALALYMFWLLTAFGVRTVVQRRRTGDSGFRGLSGTPGSSPWWAGVLFVLALLCAVAAPIATLVGLPVLIGNIPAVHALGTAIAVLGIAGTMVAQRAMGTSWRVGVDQAERTALVSGGPFARVRNPIFSAMAVTGLGLALMVPNVLALVALAALVIAVELQVRVVEEPYLRTVHGSVYATYAATAGRFVPGIGRQRARAARMGPSSEPPPIP
ncbi:isoprenylcysteine carboxylmethyltransferase family protein [Streptomyces sp. BPPL-273]|uniref:methyltransferase family protein n=1 Tax=Streptomyces TaxID=1883 RepID=UPI0024AF934A|nr:isoprenylcysteine carboxylmethyltransferase family protein [Streptomyces sp. BPPL-273]WHM29903.1 isoprenylcysteine carboxylmethyltransferase family protein [Streptomyces sp. BPPL-273]